MKNAPHISDAEWKVMKIAWKKSPILAHEIIDALTATTTWSPATIKTLLNRLIGKGVLEFEKQGKTYLYTPAYTENECRAAEADSFLSRVFDGSLSPMISHFVKNRKLTSKELDELEQILKRGRSKK